MLILTIYLATSIVMGLFGITQRGYQYRMNPVQEFFLSFKSFIQGFLFWPILFPIGLSKGKYKCNILHKVRETKSYIK